MDRNPAHRQELTRICKFWSRANVLTELAVPLEPSIRPRSRRQRASQLLLAAASVVLGAVILGWWWIQQADERNNGLYTTAIGEQQLISLVDGSSVRLNTDSQLQVSYGNRSRGIHLLRGEALFSVKPDRHRPFEVYANGSVVRAVGTAFAVQVEGRRVDVTVTKGVVEVADAADGEEVSHGRPLEREPTRARAILGRLKAGQTAVVGKGSGHIDAQQLPEPELRRRMSWRDGYLVFSGEPLSEVVGQMNRYSPVTLQIGDPQLESVAIGGRFRIGDLEAILDVLRTNFGIQALQVDEHDIRLESVHHH
jgi:transmembrane sensor